MGKLVRNLSTPQHRAWWDAVKRAAKGAPTLDQDYESLEHERADADSRRIVELEDENDTLHALIQEYKNTEAGLRHLLMRAWLAVEKEAYAEGETWEEVSCDVYWSGVGSHEAEAAAKTITNLQSRIAELERSNVTLAEHVDRLHTLNAELEADKARLDWLETDLTYTFPVQDPTEKTWWIYAVEGVGDVEDQPSLRAAIDAAMKAEE